MCGRTRKWMQPMAAMRSVHEDRHDRRDPVANQPARQRRVNARQQECGERHGGRPAGMIDDEGQHRVKGPRLVDPGTRWRG